MNPTLSRLLFKMAVFLVLTVSALSQNRQASYAVHTNQVCPGHSGAQMIPDYECNRECDERSGSQYCCRLTNSTRRVEAQQFYALIRAVFPGNSSTRLPFVDEPTAQVNVSRADFRLSDLPRSSVTRPI